MKKIWFSLLALVLGLTAMVVMTACKKTTLAQFEVPETGNGEIGAVYVIEKVTAIDSKGKKIEAQVEVKDHTGAVVKVTDYTFVPTSLEPYTITYTVKYGKKTESKVSTVNIFDLTEPTIESELEKDVFAPNGGSIDLSGFEVDDNSGEDIVPEIKVMYDGKEISDAGNTLALTQKGIYTIEVSAEDSSGNSTEETYTIHALDVLDAEHGAAFANEWYPTQISDEYARTGDYSYEVDLFGPNVSWFSDKAVFGECAILTETPYQYLSFWIYFDIEGAGFSGSVLVQDNQYETRFYDERGTEILPRWGEETDGLYEFSDGHWYRWVVDTTKVIAGADGILPSDKGPFQNPGDYSVSLGVWDMDINNNALTAVPVFIDDIKCIADAQALEASLASDWGPSSKGKKNAEYHTDGTIANYEIPEDLVSTQTCKSAEITDEKVHGGSGALKLVGYDGQTWVTGAKIFRATDARGATRAALWVYIPYDTDDPGAVGTIRLHEGSDMGQTLSGQKAYAQNADGTLRALQTLQNENKVWYTTVPLNTWICIEFDLPLFGISEVAVVVDGLYMDGAMLTMEDLGTNCLAVYIDDVAYVTDREYPVIADFERAAEGVIVNPGCARAEISSEEKHGGLYSLRLEGWETTSWVTASNLFAATDAAEATRVSFWAYVPCIKEGEKVTGTFKFEGLVNAEYYTEDSQGVPTSIEKPLLNGWIRVECDLPEDGISALVITVSEVWEEGNDAPETAAPVVYIDDVCFVTEE